MTAYPVMRSVKGLPFVLSAHCIMEKLYSCSVTNFAWPKLTRSQRGCCRDERASVVVLPSITESRKSTTEWDHAKLLTLNLYYFFFLLNDMRMFLINLIKMVS